MKPLLPYAGFFVPYHCTLHGYNQITPVWVLSDITNLPRAELNTNWAATAKIKNTLVWEYNVQTVTNPKCSQQGPFLVPFAVSPLF